MEFPFRPSTLADREHFYTEDFDIMKLRQWFVRQPQFFGIDLGSETGITTDPSKKMKIILLQGLSPAELRQRMIKYLPEDVYYDTTRYKNPSLCASCKGKNCYACENFLGRELVFDIDPENIECPVCGKKEYPKFCKYCLKISLDRGVYLRNYLTRNLGYKDVRLVYSGRGCHVHVLDENAFKLSQEERQRMARNFKLYSIDPWVTTKKRLIRLPYSLNAMVSRIVIPINPDEISSFDATKDSRVIPCFLRCYSRT
ncbi:MAG: DNA primase small subunit domain-containing protein [Candidatus Woesearchaeota archaeon]